MDGQQQEPPSLLASIINAPKRPRLTEPARCARAPAAATAVAGPPPRAAPPPPRAAPPPAPAPAFYASSRRLDAVEARVARFLAAVQRRVRRGGGGGGAAEEDAVWALFPTQAAAFERADALDPDGRALRVFSVEAPPAGGGGAGGRRRFLVASPAGFWRRYAAMPPGGRHWYEIIRGGWPCHLYFDLEFCRAANPGADGAAAVAATLGLAGELLAARHGVALAACRVVELDSSTPAKFSRHVVVRAPGAAWASAAHAGAFVAELCAAAAARAAAGDAAAARLLVAPPARAGGGAGEAGEQPRVSFVDRAVYSRNRAFRLFLSSKAGKAATLVALRPRGAAVGEGAAAAGASAPPPALTRDEEEELFHASLVCSVDPDATLLRSFDAVGGGAPPPATAGAAGALRVLRGGGGGGAEGGGGVGRPNRGPSPFPALDAFVACVASAGGVPAEVRSWTAARGGLLLFAIGRNRWCGNVGRPHRSNGVFYSVDLAAGEWRQRCFDPDCRGYRSPPTPLPPHLAGLWRGAGGGGDDDGIDDAAMVAAAEAAEREEEERRRRRGAAAGADAAGGRPP